jgi:hypothetical protein
MNALREGAPSKLSPGPALPSTWRLVCAALAAAPFLSIYLMHYLGVGLSADLRARAIPTGFIQYDQAYYSANGREVFERGNGFTHPNPYDPDPQSPAIYFHWLTWLLGFGIKKLGFDPGVQYVALGVLASLVCCWLTFRLVERILPERPYQTLLYFLVMWGGGTLCLGRAVSNLLHQRPLHFELLAYDPAGGYWFLNWGRNLIYPTEAVYHCLVAGTWLAILGGRWTPALLGTALLAATHPFSGLELLLMVFAWLSLLLLVQRSRVLLIPWLVLMVQLALFFWYYGIYLNSFEQHRGLHQVWSLQWTLSASTMLLAYGPVALLAAWRVWSDRHRLDAPVYFFATCFAVCFLLAKHDWFLNPQQPLHFTRGYVWTPLCLIALPGLQQLLLSLRSRMYRLSFGMLLLCLGAVAVSDNAIFGAGQSRHEVGFYLTPEDQEMFSWMERQGLDGVLLCPSIKESYLSATYTSMRPYVGHVYNTPRHRSRAQDVRLWFEQGQTGPWMGQVDYILIPNGPIPRAADKAPWEQRLYARVNPYEWEPLHENREWILFRRKSAAR